MQISAEEVESFLSFGCCLGHVDVKVELSIQLNSKVGVV